MRAADSQRWVLYHNKIEYTRGDGRYSRRSLVAFATKSVTYLNQRQRMSSLIRPSLTVEIVLSRDKETDAAAAKFPVYHCGEEINGSLRAITTYDLYFDIVLSFEGCYEILVHKIKFLLRNN